jgi:tRNA threonylcarbamoyladenosine biosynthesis protein TsaB
MASLRQILATHGSLLLLDAASGVIQVGLLDAGAAGRWQTSAAEAGAGIFKCLEDLRLDLPAIPAFAFCEGPGSILGIRTTAMAIRAWQALRSRPVYHYRSLDLVAHALNRPGAQIIADARRDLWHCQMLGQPMRRVPAASIQGERFMPEGFRHWSTLPAGTGSTSYTLPELWPRVADADLFSVTAEPDAFLHEAPNYRTWQPQVHRAP